MGNDDPSDSVYRSDDGYWRVRGQPEETYYPTEEIARRVVAERAAAEEEGEGNDEGDDEIDGDAHNAEHDDPIPETE